MTKKSLTQTADNMPVVTSIVIYRNGVDLASISEHFPLRQFVPDAKVSGHLSSSHGTRAALVITWPHPSDSEVANYTCDVTSMNAQGHTFVFSQTTTVSEAQVSISDIVRQLHQLTLEKEQMQKMIADQASVIQELNVTDHKMESSLQSDLSQVNQSVASLSRIARVEPNVVFSALLSSFQSFAKNQVVVYDHIITNEGLGYDRQTGIFTCPVDGFYYFEIHALSQSFHGFVNLFLLHNSVGVISVNIYDTNDYNEASNSVTIRLRKNDQVKVVSWNDGSKLTGDENRKANTFNGRLIFLA